MVSALRQFSYEDRLQRLNIPTMKFRRAMGDLVEVYKHLNFYDKLAVAHQFVPRTRPSRRHGQELKRHFAEDGFNDEVEIVLLSKCKVMEQPTTQYHTPSVHVFKKRLNEHLKFCKKFGFFSIFLYLRSLICLWSSTLD